MFQFFNLLCSLLPKKKKKKSVIVSLCVSLGVISFCVARQKRRLVWLTKKKRKGGHGNDEKKTELNEKNKKKNTDSLYFHNSFSASLRAHVVIVESGRALRPTTRSAAPPTRVPYLSGKRGGVKGWENTFFCVFEQAYTAGQA